MSGNRASTMSGYALRVGNEVWVRNGASEADIDAAWALMSESERLKASKQIVRDLRWTAWRLKHPKLAALIDSAAYCGAALVCLKMGALK